VTDGNNARWKPEITCIVFQHGMAWHGMAVQQLTLQASKLRSL